MAEDEQFAKDVAKAIELSKITAADDDDRRQRLGILPMATNDYGNGRSMPNSRSSPSLMKNGGNSESTKTARSPAPSPTPLSNMGSSDSSAGKNGASVRARPRPSSGRVSPASMSSRRSGIIESNDSDRLTLPSPRSTSPWDSPRDSIPGNTTVTSGSVTKRGHSTVWEQFEFNDSTTTSSVVVSGANPFDLINDSSTNAYDSASTTTSNDPFAVEASPLQNPPGRRDRADSATNLIALSPMDKDKISKHYNLDLDSLFGQVSSTTATTSTMNGFASLQTTFSRPSPRISSANQMPLSFNSANQRTSFSSTNQHSSPHNLANQESLSASWPSPSNSLLLDPSLPRAASPVGKASLQPPSTVPVLLPTTLPKADSQSQPAPTSISTTFDINDFFGDFLTSRTAESSLPMPSYTAPSLPAPPPVPARSSFNSQSTTKKTSLHIKKVSTPNSDLLDLGGDLKLPEISSVQLLDPLFTAPEGDRRGMEEQITDLSSKLAGRLAYTVTDCEDMEEEALLQDPFSYEELSMTLMESSRIKGDDVLIEEEEIVEESAVYESLPSTPESGSPSAGAGQPQLPPKFRSLSVNSTKYLKIPDNETMDEFTAFSVAVARLKADYKYDDKYTNLGILFSPTVNIPAVQGMTVEITVYTEMASEPIEFNLDVSTSVEIIIWNVMSRISCDFLELSVDDYILKVFNYSEFLVNDSTLSDYAYTHNCLKLNESLRFSLHVVASLHKPFLRKVGDDDEPIYMIKGELHGDKSYKKEPKDLKYFYDVFCKQHEAVNKTALESGLAKLGVIPMLQSVKAITYVLLGAESLDVRTAAEHLKSTLSEVDNNIYDDLKYTELMDDFMNSMENLSTGVKNLISMYCSTFHVTYSPSSLPPVRREIKEVTDSLENILVHVGSVHRIPANIRGRLDHYKVTVSLYYAGHSFTDHTSTDVYSTIEHSNSTDTIYFDQWLELTDFPMCLVPLETRVTFTLSAMNTAQPVSGSGSNALNKWNNIGWVSFMFFDFRRKVTQGSKLLSLWHGTPNVSGATGSNIFQPNTTLLQVNLPDFGFDLRFPSLLFESTHPRAVKSRLGVGEEDIPIEHMLPDGDLEELNSILFKEDEKLNTEDKEFLWSRKDVLKNTLEALPKVLLSAPQLNYTGIHSIQDTLDMWTPLTALEALRLLLPDFPCQLIRNYAVKCLKSVSSDEMCDYLPQLVQALKFENYHDSALSRLLLERSITSVRLAHQLYWYLKEGASQPAYRERYKLLFGGLVSVMGKSLREELEREELLVRCCNTLADQVKEAKGDSKDKVMSKEVLSISDLLRSDTLRLPTHPGLEVNGLDLKLCTYFNSFTLPLRLVFKNAEHGAPSHYLMYKVGDDLRQDMIVMQLISIMGKLWLQNDLDMRLVTFTCLHTGDKRGMVEIINECETLRKIQTSSGITGSFKDQPLANWLQKHNPTQTDYKRAVENFTLSCAGYCVATYILGVGDRHNDNIMVKRTGHIFHIDFSKFLGDSQMFGNIKRDRTPFVLTPDMAYVINGGDKPTQKFQDFVDLCCEAFNVIRENADSIITLLKMMTSSGIKGVTAQAIQYVRTALLPEQTNSEATASFTRMIEESLKSKFVQLNFFIHNLAQLKFSSHSDGELLSFIPTSYSMATDGRIINVEIYDKQKRYQPEKHYIYIIKVHRERQREASLVYRRYSEFQEFYGKLVSLFPMASIPRLPGSVVLGRTHVHKVAEKRKAELETFLRELLMQAKEISEHDLLYTFFHPMLRDEAESSPPDTATFKDSAVRSNVKVITGEVKLSMHYKQHALQIMIMHVKGLSSESGDRPNPYVKLYLLPDPIKTTKRKTKISRSTFHPTYNEMLEYRLPLQEVRQRTLQVTVWSAEMTGNEFLGAIHLNLCDADFTTKEWTEWHKLSALHRIRS